MDEHYDEFERVYSQRYEKTYGFWRPVIGDVVGKFLACGDLREGFARVRRLFALLVKRGKITPAVARNFQVFDPLDFLAEVTQHIPEPRAHTIRYFGWYSNKARGMRARQSAQQDEPQEVVNKMQNSVYS